MKTKFSSLLSLLYDLFEFSEAPHVEFDDKKMEALGLDEHDVILCLNKMEKEKIIIDCRKHFYPLPNEQFKYTYIVIANKKILKEKLKELGIKLPFENNRGVVFDPQARVFRCGNSIYKIQKGNLKRFKIARELYDNRKIVMDKKVVKKGMSLTKGQLVVTMDDTKSAQKLSPSDIKKVENEIKALNREFGKKEHEIPLRIRISGSVLMTETISE